MEIKIKGLFSLFLFNKRKVSIDVSDFQCQHIRIIWSIIVQFRGNHHWLTGLLMRKYCYERERERNSAEVSEKDIGTEQCTHVRAERGTTVLGTSPLMLGRRDSERDKATLNWCRYNSIEIEHYLKLSSEWDSHWLLLSWYFLSFPTQCGASSPRLEASLSTGVQAARGSD